MARSAWLRLMSAGFFGGSLGLLVLGGCFTNVGAQQGACVDDTNPCTVDTCDANNVPIHTPVPNADKVQCFLGENEGTCTDGTCELICKTQMTPCKCTVKEDCPLDTVCGTWACTMGECVNTPLMEGMTADPLEPGDCQKKICQGGSLKIVDDPMDTATDAKGDCQDPVCNAGVPGTMANDNDVPVMDDMPGNCSRPACNGGVLGTAPDMNDFPKATGCQTFSCDAMGMMLTADSPVGTVCGQDMACDRMGKCVICLPAGKDDYEKCKMNNGGVCPVPKCEGQPCASKSECSKECTDGVCCDTACTEECKSCTVAGSEGKCTAIPFLGEDAAYTDPVFMTTVACNGVKRCSATGKCGKVIGTGCTLNTECISGVCAMPAKVCLGAKGEGCSNNQECASGVCKNMTFCD